MGLQSDGYSNPDDILADLDWVFAELRDSMNRGDSLDLTLAIFLQRFFEVHPFIDGNGRIARLFCDLLASSNGQQFIWRAEAEANYTAGLEMGHAGRARNSSHADDEHDPRRIDCLDPLRAIVRELLADRNLDSVEEEPQL